MAKKASTYPASEWARSFTNPPMSEHVAVQLCRDGRVKGATNKDPNYYGRWMVIKGTPDPRHPVGAPRKTTNGKVEK